jgi:hypothetical protein
MARKGHIDWSLPENNSWEVIHAALLMDLRDELKKLNALLGCENFIAVPRILRSIRANTTKPKPKRRKKARHA